MALDKKTLEQLEKRLKEQKIKAETELASFAQKDERMKGDYDTRFPDFGTPQSPDEAAMEVSTYASTLPVEYALELRLVDINRALDKIEKGEYGLCEKCGRPIDQKRLEAMPEARTCVDCNK